MAVVAATRTIAGQCENLMTKLTEHSLVNGETFRDRLAFIGRYDNDDGSISSGFFRSPFNQMFNLEAPEVMRNEDGTIRRVIARYLQRAVIGDVLTDMTNLCTAATEVPYQEFEFNGDNMKVARKKFTINYNNWKKVCESPDNLIKQRWMACINAINQKVDLEVAKDVINGRGANAGHANPTTIPTVNTIATYKAIDLVNDTTRQPLWAGVDEFHKDMALNEISGIPAAVIFGIQNKFRTFTHAKDVGCCNDLGQDLRAVVEKMNNLAPFMGRQVQAAFVALGLANNDAEANSAAIVLNPGAAHLIETFDYDYYPYTDGSSYGTTWIDPVSGEKYDVMVDFATCTGPLPVVTVNIYKTYKAVTMPTDQYKAGDTKENQNGVYLYSFT